MHCHPSVSWAMGLLEARAPFIFGHSCHKVRNCAIKCCNFSSTSTVIKKAPKYVTDQSKSVMENYI